MEQKGLFIKNLENIQGDERDVILIATTFGERPDGRFTANYGPLTRKEIGRRLLNVIITRAKKKVFIFTSIPQDRCLNYPEELSGPNINEGGYLHAYLCYAKAVSEGEVDTIQSILSFFNENEGDHSTQNFITESPFEEAVMEALLTKIPEERIETQYKAGGFRIDIVVKSKKTGKAYIAIECDGAAYHGSLEDYAWDSYRQKRLEEFGFVFHRIWSRDWWENSERELDKLIRFIEKQDEKEEVFITQYDPSTEHLEFGKYYTSYSGPVNKKRDKQTSIFEETVEENVTQTSDKGIAYTQSDFSDDLTLIKVGSKVTVKYLDNNKVATFKIAHGDSKFKQSNGVATISEASPIGKAALGRKVGDKFEINGLERYCEILEVE